MDDELCVCIDMGWFVMFKDVSCDFVMVKCCVVFVVGLLLKILNVNVVIVWDVMKVGLVGFNGVFINFYFDFY